MWEQDLYHKALKFAAKAHQEQKYPGTNLPYIIHPVSVAMEVMYICDNDDIDADLAVQSALLHDTIEDTEITYDDLSSEFGTQIADGVLALSKNEKLDKFEQMGDSLNRIKKQSHEIWVVKMADRISNLQKPPHYWTKQKIKHYQEEALFIFESLKNGNEYIAQRLRNKIKEYEKFIK